MLIGAITVWLQYHDNKVADGQAARAMRTANAGHATAAMPSTNKPTPSAFDAYRAAPTNPRYIFIPKLAVRAIVRPLGLTKDNHLDAPTNIYEAGWYTGSAKPGQPGVTVVDGHVSSWTARGIFYGLKSLKPGDTIQVERGDGQLLHYSIVKSQVYKADAVDMAAVLSAVEPNVPGLNLITCDGAVIRGTNDFDQRIVVFAKQT